jgi:mannose-1-phosphate guanylyltransferase/phosphomannomutase
MKEIEKHFSRQEFRRVSADEVGEIRYPARAAETYAQDLLGGLDVELISGRGFRVVVDYGYSAASLVLPLVLGELGVEAIAARAYVREQRVAPAGRDLDPAEDARRLVEAAGADLGVALDPSAERLRIVDEQARVVAPEVALLLFERLVAGNGSRGKLAFPVTVTSQVDRLAEGTGFEVERTPASLEGLTSAAARDGVVFAGSATGGFVFPDFLPGYDGVASLCKLLELLAPVGRPLSELVDELPRPHVVHRTLRCPWALKGTVMRVLTEQMKDKRMDTPDGLKLAENGGWVQVLPDPAEPVVHIYAEGESDEESERLEREISERVEAIIAGGEG